MQMCIRLAHGKSDFDKRIKALEANAPRSRLPVSKSKPILPRLYREILRQKLTASSIAVGLLASKASATQPLPSARSQHDSNDRRGLSQRGIENMRRDPAQIASWCASHFCRRKLHNLFLLGCGFLQLCLIVIAKPALQNRQNLRRLLSRGADDKNPAEAFFISPVAVRNGPLHIVVRSVTSACSPADQAAETAVVAFSA